VLRCAHAAAAAARPRNRPPYEAPRGACTLPRGGPGFADMFRLTESQGTRLAGAGA